MLLEGDCLAILPTLDADSIDAVVTDPPYELGFMGKSWDASGVAFSPATWREVLRVMKPGAHLVAFGAPRNYHRLACAIEDAGFEVRDSLMWVFGSGFPKSLDVSKAIDKAAGAEREIISVTPRSGNPINTFAEGQTNLRPWQERQREQFGGLVDIKTAPATDAGREWQGWGTALKPAYEPIILARKPLSEKTVAANVLRWGTGALNIDATRIETTENLNGGAYAKVGNRVAMAGDQRDGAALGMFQPGKTAGSAYAQPIGRWPANLAHDGSEEVLAGFPTTKSGVKTGGQYARMTGVHEGGQRKDGEPCYADEGSAARFFYCAKAGKADRAGSKHPTVKPVSLMRWLVRMVTPPNGTLLDPFAGSGTTGQAAIEEGFNAVLIEREPEYQADIRRRLGLRSELGWLDSFMAGAEEYLNAE